MLRGRGAGWPVSPGLSVMVTKAARGNLSRQDGTEVYRGDERGEEPSGGGNAQHVRASVGAS